jgi:hypothetical protein
MPLLPPPDAIIKITVSQIPSSTWTFQSDVNGLVTPQGAIDLDSNSVTKNKSPVYIQFKIKSGDGIIAAFPASSPPSIIIWNQKPTGPDCASADKTAPPDSSQGAKITYLDSTDIMVKYGNHKGNNGKVSLKCNFYSMNMNVGDASNPPSLQNLDPIINNGDGSVGCTGDHGNFVPCRTRRHHPRSAHP